MAISLIGFDPTMTSGVQSTSGSTGTQNFMNHLALATQAAGPVVESSLWASGNTSAATIAGAAANATYGSAMAFSGGNQFSTVGAPGYTNQYSTGGLGMGMSGAGGTDMEGLMNESFNNQMYMMTIQVRTQGMQNQTMMQSNVVKSRDESMKSVIQNIR